MSFIFGGTTASEAVTTTNMTTRRSSFFLLMIVLSLFVLSPLPSSVDLNENKTIANENEEEELSETLKRQAKGRAAVVIVRVVDDTVTDGIGDKNNTKIKYLVQRKSNDYPIKPFQDAICLFGGNAKPSDKDGPKQTLFRELNEELPKGLVSLITQKPLRLYSTTLNSQSAQLINKNESYTFLCACYEATISVEELKSVSGTDDMQNSINEGTYTLLTKEELLHDEKYAWGYDYVISWYFNSRVANFCGGVTVKKVSDSALKSWTPEF